MSNTSSDPPFQVCVGGVMGDEREIERERERERERESERERERARERERERERERANLLISILYSQKLTNLEE